MIMQLPRKRLRTALVLIWVIPLERSTSVPHEVPYKSLMIREKPRPSNGFAPGGLFKD